MSLSLRCFALLSCCLLPVPIAAATQDVQKCVTISDDRARLVCYDQAMGRTSTQQANTPTAPPTAAATEQTLPVATDPAVEATASSAAADVSGSAATSVVPPNLTPAAPAAQAATSQPAVSAPPASQAPVVTEAEFGLPEERDDDAVKNNRITAAVVDVDKTPLGSLVVELDNAHVWQQVDGNRLTLRKGDEVLIREGMGGSFYMAKTSGSRSLKVRRIK